MAARAETLSGRSGTRGVGSRLAPLVLVLEREAFPIAAVALYAVAVLVAMPGELVQDSWATLVAGRAIASDGLPHHETLTVMAYGARWVDQQWLAQLTFYELFRAGGYRLILLTHAALIASAFGLGVWTARRRGGGPIAVFGVALLCFFVAPWGWQMRAQSFAPLLFVAVFSLLLLNGRDRPRRALWSLPLLVVWANLHGSVVLGALLVALFGLLLLLERRESATGAALLTLAPLSVVCSPYAPSLVGYYRTLLINPPFRGMLVEWTAPRPQAITALFFVLAFVTVWALGRHGSALTWFERIALLVTLASALSATRNIVWFGLAALMLLPILLSSAENKRAGARPAVRLVFASTALAGLAVAVALTATKPSSWYEGVWSRPAASKAAEAASAGGKDIFASDRLADWLLWREPTLGGRVAFDIRFELYSSAQVKALHRYFGRIGPHWQRVAHGYRVIVLDRGNDDAVRRSLESSGRWARRYLDKDIVVLTPNRGHRG